MTCQGISLGLVSIGCCCFLSVTRRGLLFFLHTDCLGGHGGSSCHEFANLRIFFFSSHGMARNNLFFHKFSNLFHTVCRGGHGFFLITRLVLGSTDRSEVIREFFLHTDCRGIIFFITNYRIIEYLSHGMSRRSRIFSCHETCPWTH